jgi:hypothetical protein
MNIKPVSCLASLACLVLLFQILRCNAQILEWQKSAILDVFNEARRTTVVPAANMKELKWDEDLAAQAQAFTNDCQPPGASFGRPVVGGWLAYWDHMPNPVAVAKWRTLRMAPYYDYEVRYIQLLKGS